jgi:hypothetical protein
MILLISACQTRITGMSYWRPTCAFSLEGGWGRLSIAI